MKHVARIARLEWEGERLLRRIRSAQTLYDSDWLRSAWERLRLVIADLRLAKTSAEIRRSED